MRLVMPLTTYPIESVTITVLLHNVLSSILPTSV